MSREERREQLLGAAERVFAAHGYAGATTRLLAAEAGVSEGLIFKHFADKQELFVALARRLVDEQHAATLRHVARAVVEDGVEAKVRTFVESYLAWVAVRRDLLRVVYVQGAAHPEVLALFAAASADEVATVRDLLAGEITRGGFRAVDVDLAARALRGSVVWLGILTPAIEPDVVLPGPAELAARLTDLYLRGLRAPAGAVAALDVA